MPNTIKWFFVIDRKTLMRDFSASNRSLLLLLKSSIFVFLHVKMSLLFNGWSLTIYQPLTVCLVRVCFLICVHSLTGNTVCLRGTKKLNGHKAGGASLFLPKMRRNPLIEIIAINTG